MAQLGVHGVLHVEKLLRALIVRTMQRLFVGECDTGSRNAHQRRSAAGREEQYKVVGRQIFDRREDALGEDDLVKEVGTLVAVGCETEPVSKNEDFEAFARDVLRDLRPVKGEMLVLRSPDLDFARPLRMLHPRMPVYIVPRGDGVYMVGATMIENAEQGRVTVPGPLRQWAGLARDLVVVGADTRIEIWDQNAWDHYLALSEPGFASLDEEILP